MSEVDEWVLFLGLFLFFFFFTTPSIIMSSLPKLKKTLHLSLPVSVVLVHGNKYCNNYININESD